MSKVARVLALAVVVVCLAQVFYLNYLSRKPEVPIKIVRVAVLPLKNTSGDAKLDYLGYGMAGTIVIRLSMVPGIDPIGGAAVRKAITKLGIAPDSSLDPAAAAKLGKELHANYVAIGSFERKGDIIKERLQCIDSETETALTFLQSVGTYDSPPSNVQDLQLKLAQSLIKACAPDLTAIDADAMNVSAKCPVAAFEWFSRGEKQCVDGDQTGAVASYTKALAVTPSYLEALITRGNLYVDMHENDKAQKDYNAAITLAPKYSTRLDGETKTED